MAIDPIIQPTAVPMLTGPTRATVVAVLARMVVAELEREHQSRTERQPETNDEGIATKACRVSGAHPTDPLSSDAA
jgi:hypothetical protein